VRSIAEAEQYRLEMVRLES